MTLLSQNSEHPGRSIPRGGSEGGGRAGSRGEPPPFLLRSAALRSLNAQHMAPSPEEGRHPRPPPQPPGTVFPPPAGSPVIMHLDIWTHPLQGGPNNPSLSAGSPHSRCQVWLRKQLQQPRITGLQSSQLEFEALVGGVREAVCSSASFPGLPGSRPRLLLGDLKHAEALILL